MRKLHFILLTQILLILAASFTSATTLLSPEKLATQVQNRFDQLSSLSFSFTQTSKGQFSSRTLHGSGKAIFLKSSINHKGKMRWDYSEPDTQILLMDGERFIMYFKKLNQMIVSPATIINSDITYSFFTGQATLQNNFHILPADNFFITNNRSNRKIIQLVPKDEQSQLASVHIWINDNFIIEKLAIKDLFDTTTIINLNNIILNPLKSLTGVETTDIFSFIPPEQTEIINNGE